MMKLFLIFVMCVLVVAGGKGGNGNRGNGNRGKCKQPRKCPFKPGSDLVTPEDLKKEVDGTEWVIIYYTNFTAIKEFGKCTYKLNAPDADKTVRRQLVCYNIFEDNCEDFEEKVIIGVDACGRAEETSVNTNFSAKYYSQDIHQYFWYLECYEVDDNGECTEPFLDLLVRASRLDPETGELNLEGLKWHLIAIDLQRNFDLKFSDDIMYYTGNGPCCGLDGNII